MGFSFGFRGCGGAGSRCASCVGPSDASCPMGRLGGLRVASVPGSGFGVAVDIPGPGDRTAALIEAIDAVEDEARAALLGREAGALEDRGKGALGPAGAAARAPTASRDSGSMGRCPMTGRCGERRRSMESPVVRG